MERYFLRIKRIKRNRRECLLSKALGKKKRIILRPKIVESLDKKCC
jgi:hypothetical protein